MCPHAVEHTERLLKLLPAETDFGRAHAEMAALQMLRLPGIPGLIEVGNFAGRPYLVTEFAAGAHFPGADLPMPWPLLEPIARRLLAILASVHRAGFVHCDLKPANVLVDAEGRVTLLDFGLATARRPGRAGAGTMRYSAPEQKHGQQVGAATDLWAFGHMLIEALLGGYHGRARSRQALAALSDLPAHLPQVIVDCVAPDRRPRSAEQLLRAFIGEDARPFPRLDQLEDAASPAELHDLFSGPEPIFHLRSDAAAELWARTAGRAADVRAELRAWIDSGLALPDGDRLLVEAAAITQLEAGLSVSQSRTHRSKHLAAHRSLLLAIDLAWPFSTRDVLARLLGGAPVDASLATLRRDGAIRQLPGGRYRVDDVRFEPASMERDGHLLAALAEHLPAEAPQRPLHLVRAHRVAEAARLSLTRARAALQEGDARRADATLAGIAPLIDGGVVSLSTRRAIFAAWVEAAWYLHDDRHLHAVLVGMGATPIDDLVALLRARLFDQPLPAPFAEPQLELLRRYAAHRRGAPVSCEPGDHPILFGQAVVFEARAHYRAMRWRAAGEAYERAAEALPLLQRRATLIDAGSAWLEALDLDAARRCVDQVLPDARRIRHGYHEGRAYWLQRAIEHRAGAVLAADPEWEAAVRRFDFPPLIALALTNEAAIAWQARRLGACAALAAEAAAAWRAMRQPSPALLCDCLRAAVLQRPPAPLPTLDAIAGQPVPGVALQMAALLAAAGDDRPALRSIAPIPPVDPRRRLTILSVLEAQALLR